MEERTTMMVNADTDTSAVIDGQTFAIKAAELSELDGIVAYFKRQSPYSILSMHLLLRQQSMLGVEDLKRLYKKKIESNTSAVFLAVDADGTVIGVASITFEAPSSKKAVSEEKINNEGWIAVSRCQEREGEGIARSLVNEIIDWAKDHTKINILIGETHDGCEKTQKMMKDLGFNLRTRGNQIAEFELQL